METKLDHVVRVLVDIRNACDQIEQLNAFDSFSELKEGLINNRLKVIRLCASHIEEVANECHPSED